jgi:hypothetical protein
MPKYIVVTSNGARMIGTSAIRAKRAKKIPRRSILGSLGREFSESIASTSDLAREAPSDTKIKGIATAPAVSTATKRELWIKLEGLKNNSR